MLLGGPLTAGIRARLYRLVTFYQTSTRVRGPRGRRRCGCWGEGGARLSFMFSSSLFSLKQLSFASHVQDTDLLVISLVDCSCSIDCRTIRSIDTTSIYEPGEVRRRENRELENIKDSRAPPSP